MKARLVFHVAGVTVEIMMIDGDCLLRLTPADWSHNFYIGGERIVRGGRGGREERGGREGGGW